MSGTRKTRIKKRGSAKVTRSGFSSSCSNDKLEKEELLFTKEVRILKDEVSEVYNATFFSSEELQVVRHRNENAVWVYNPDGTCECWIAEDL